MLGGWVTLCLIPVCSLAWGGRPDSIGLAVSRDNGVESVASRSQKALSAQGLSIVEPYL